MKWNPDDFYGIQHVAIPTDQIWLPDIVLTNRFAFIFLLKEKEFIKLVLI